MSRGNASVEFLVGEDRAVPLQDLAIAARIEKLFGVRLSASRTRDPPGLWVTCHGSSENGEKAKRYTLALCSPSFATELPATGIERLLFAENSRLRDELEKEHQAVIEPSLSSGIRIKGREDDVSLTVSKLNGLRSTTENGHPPPPPSSLYSLTPRDGSHDIALLTSSSSMASPSMDLDQQLREAIQRVGEDPAAYEKMSSPVKRALLEGLRGPPHRSSPPPSGHGVIDLHQERRIDFFVGLNFPREKVVSVLEALPSDVDDDKVMARLVSLTSTDPKSRVSGGGGGLGGGGARAVGPGVTGVSNPTPVKDPTVLRPIVIDGSNVAMRHGKGQVFSCRGIQIAVQWFRKRGHKEIKVFVPSWRKEASRPESMITDREILLQLEREGFLHFTPSRRIGQKRIVCYDDRFILRLASEIQGVVVSTDQFRDLMNESTEWREIVEKRLLMFTFVDDMFMIPEDPLGRRGPRLEEFLQLDPKVVQTKGAVAEKPGQKLCPYMERCTFGKRCKFYHPERDGRGGGGAGGGGGVEGGTPTAQKSTSRSNTPSPVPEKLYPNRDNQTPSIEEEERGERGERKFSHLEGLGLSEVQALADRMQYCHGNSDGRNVSSYHPKPYLDVPSAQRVSSPIHPPSRATYPLVNLHHAPPTRVHTEDFSYRSHPQVYCPPPQEREGIPMYHPQVVPRDPQPSPIGLMPRGFPVPSARTDSYCPQYSDGSGFVGRLSYPAYQGDPAPHHSPHPHPSHPHHHDHPQQDQYLISRPANGHHADPYHSLTGYRNTHDHSQMTYGNHYLSRQSPGSMVQYPLPHLSSSSSTSSSSVASYSHPHSLTRHHPHSSPQPSVCDHRSGIDHADLPRSASTLSLKPFDHHLFELAAAVLPGYEKAIHECMCRHPSVTSLEKLIVLVQDWIDKH